MTTRRLFWALAPMLVMACATTMPDPADQFPRRYTREEVAHIMSLRDEGESLAEVAKQVGGTRHSVRLAERQELARRRGQQTAAITPTTVAQQ